MSNKNLKDSWEYLSRLEEKYKLYEFKIYDYPLWNGCKERVLDWIIGNKNVSSTRRRKEPKNLIISLLRIIDGFFKITRVKPIDILFVSNSRFRRGDGESENAHIYFDNIIDHLDKSFKHSFIEYPTFSEYDRKFFKSRSYKNVIPVDLFGFIAILFTIIKRNEINKANKEIEEISNELRNDIDNDLLSKISIWLKSIAKEWIVWNHTLSWLFKRLSPSLIIDIANAGRFSHLSLPNVKKIEIQHGIIHKYHPAYSIPDSGKPNFEYFYRNKSIIVYNENYKETISKYGVVPGDRLLIIDNLRIWGFNYVERNIVFERLKIEEDKKIILISSQPLEDAQARFTQFIKYFAENRFKIKELVKYIIVVKLHPREDIGITIYKSIPNIVIVKDEIHLFDLLNVSSVHIGYTSTVIEEATYFSILNIILPNADTEGKYDNLIHDNSVIKLNTIEDFKNIIKQHPNNKMVKAKDAYIKNPYLKINEFINLSLKLK